jgi:TonB family protein
MLAAGIFAAFVSVESKRIGESGTARLYVRVSEAGCVTEAIMTASTGYARLDAAALDFMSHSRFKPAEIGGHAAASGSVFKLAFNLVRAHLTMAEPWLSRNRRVE